MQDFNFIKIGLDCGIEVTLKRNPGDIGWMEETEFAFFISGESACRQNEEAEIVVPFNHARDFCDALESISKGFSFHLESLRTCTRIRADIKSGNTTLLMDIENVLMDIENDCCDVTVCTEVTFAKPNDASSIRRSKDTAGISVREDHVIDLIEAMRALARLIR